MMEITEAFSIPLSCPKCEIDRIKVELKLLPTKFLTCQKCQAVYRLIGNQLFQVAL